MTDQEHDDVLFTSLLLLMDGVDAKTIGSTLHRYLVKTRPGDLYPVLNTIDEQRMARSLVEVSVESIIEQIEEDGGVFTGTHEDIWGRIQDWHLPDRIYEYIDDAKHEMRSELSALIRDFRHQATCPCHGVESDERAHDHYKCLCHGVEAPEENKSESDVA